MDLQTQVTATVQPRLTGPLPALARAIGLLKTTECTAQAGVGSSPGGGGCSFCLVLWGVGEMKLRDCHPT